MKHQAMPLFVSSAFSIAMFVSGCSDKSAAPAAPVEIAEAPAKPLEAAPAAATPADVAAEAAALFAGRCTPCHGAGGGGDGAASAGLTPKPANFTLPEWQASVTDEHLEKIIVYGGLAVAKSAAMPPNPDLDGKPVVQALRAYIRGLKK